MKYPPTPVRRLRGAPRDQVLSSAVAVLWSAK
jgi:hypothetical protein